jgi:N-carbamoylputrescine amidase
MRLTLVQMNSRKAAREENVARACAYVDEAASHHPEIVVLPEFFNNEYVPQYRDYRYMDYAETDDGYTLTRLKAKAKQHGIHVVSTIFEMARPGLYYNTAMLIGRSTSVADRRSRCSG